MLFKFSAIESSAFESIGGAGTREPSERLLKHRQTTRKTLPVLRVPTEMRLGWVAPSESSRRITARRRIPQLSEAISVRFVPSEAEARTAHDAKFRVGGLPANKERAIQRRARALQRQLVTVTL